MYERFGFYGMQAIMVLYAAAPRDRAGLGLSAGDAAALFGAWIGLTFLLSLPGGWVADRLCGAWRAMMVGAVVNTAGYLCLTLPVPALTVPGLALLAAGTGLYKPNYQAMVNTMFRNHADREAGISLLYIGIQFSALVAPLVTGFLGEQVNWHLGFAVAGAVMLLCLVQLTVARRQFGTAGAQPGRPLSPRGRRSLVRWSAGAGVGSAGLIAAVLATGGLPPRALIALVGLACLVAPVAGFVVLHRNPELDDAARTRLRAMLWIFLGSTLFWMIVAQDGSVLTLFARDHTDREVAGFVVPASWLQSLTPLFVLLLAPVFAAVLPRIWPGPGGVPVKYSVGLFLAGGSFLLMAVAATLATGGRVSPGWLLVVFLMHACGELIIAAVGIAATADILPPAFLSHTLGLWWLFAALGGGLGAQVVRLADAFSLTTYFLLIGVAVTAFGGLLLARAGRTVRGLMAVEPIRVVETADAMVS
ncbi:MAG: MFS transporter [Actinobacteria bacterium 13_1_20CM_3_71_11]|nr:MAG: MFS transporter [Actinobacteria bacterium 13_1_20CM_3_71_11]